MFSLVLAFWSSGVCLEVQSFWLTRLCQCVISPYAIPLLYLSPSLSLVILYFYLSLLIPSLIICGSLCLLASLFVSRLVSLSVLLFLLSGMSVSVSCPPPFLFLCYICPILLPGCIHQDLSMCEVTSVDVDV